jgi:hypothetical protein
MAKWLFSLNKHRTLHQTLPMLCVALLAGVAVLGGSAPKAQAQAGACKLNGSPVLPKDVKIFSSSTSSDALAAFTGRSVQMEMTIPSKNTTRASVRVSTEQGKFELRGFAEVGKVPAYSAKNLAVSAGHFWIGGNRIVHLGGAAAGQVEVIMKAGYPIEQTVRTTSTCSGVSLSRPSFRQAKLPDKVRGYTLRRSSLDLLDKARGKTVFTFSSPTIKDTLLFWGTDIRGGYVHVLMRGDFVVDAWAPLGAFRALPPGEISDSHFGSSASTTVGRSNLIIKGTPRTVTVTKDVVIRNRPSEKNTAIGTIKSGGEVMVVEGILGWSNVLPTSLAMTPADSNGFWVKSSDLPARH